MKLTIAQVRVAGAEPVQLGWLERIESLGHENCYLFGGGKFHLRLVNATMKTSERLIGLFQELGAVIPQAGVSQDDLLQIREYITHGSQPSSLFPDEPVIVCFQDSLLSRGW